ncbi:MAG: metallophosphoesterase [Chloroflexota bacterium]|nr:metallophosphoesterase [Chloroflexota bacterium]
MSQSNIVGRPPTTLTNELYIEEKSPNHIRLAAVGDIHCTERSQKMVSSMFSGIEKRSDVLLLCGDITDRGRTNEMEVLINVLTKALDTGLTILAVLGNHDYHSGEERKLVALMRQAGIRVLFEDDNIFVLNDRVGFCGVKGFWGGFSSTKIMAFGEEQVKELIKETVRDVRRLNKGLRSLSTPEKVALLHYAPIKQTLRGEPAELMNLLGSDLLAGPLDEQGATLAFHGHAHFGKYNGLTNGGVPVYNVAAPVLRRSGLRPPCIHLI